VNDRDGRYARLRYTATGALATLAVVGAIAGTVALAASPGTKTLKNPSAPVPSKTHVSQPGSSQPFLTAVQGLVSNGTITAAEGQVLDRGIQAGGIDTQTLASSGFTQAQLQAVERTLRSTKEALAPSVPRTPK
jgi:hypothetical protein